MLVLMNIVNSIVIFADSKNGYRRVIRALCIPVSRLVGNGKATYVLRLTLNIDIIEDSPS